MLEAEGFHAVPSPRQPYPGYNHTFYFNLLPLWVLNHLVIKTGDDKYFSGGYTTKVHGSRDGGTIDAIQIECPSEMRIHAGFDGRVLYAQALGRAISTYYREYYE